MHAITISEATGQLQQLVAGAVRGEPSLVMQDGQPLFMAVPLEPGLDAREVRLELAVTLFARDQISIGVAARLAGLSTSEMIDEVGKRQIPVVRYSEEEFDSELALVRSLADRG